MKHTINTLVFLMFALLISCNSNSEEKKQIPLYAYDVEARIDSLGIQLKKPGAPVANFVPAVRTGNLLFLSGMGSTIKGKLGKELSVEDGVMAAKQIAERQLGALKEEIGDLNKVVRIVKVNGMVNADVGFEAHPSVINGFSDTMVAVFGERGKHARAAVGMSSLPFNIACEIEMVVEIRD